MKFSSTLKNEEDGINSTPQGVRRSGLNRMNSLRRSGSSLSKSFSRKFVNELREMEISRHTPTFKEYFKELERATCEESSPSSSLSSTITPSVSTDNDTIVETDAFETTETNKHISIATGTTFDSKFSALKMRQLALVAHNNMKPAMFEFIQQHATTLQHFRITGTATTIKMCKSVWGENNENMTFGLTCQSGPLGGDAQIAALLCMEDLGGIIFFVDPLSAHPHQADIESLIRLSHCHNILTCLNPTTADFAMRAIKEGLVTGSKNMLLPFFRTLESPAISQYKADNENKLKESFNTMKENDDEKKKGK